MSEPAAPRDRHEDAGLSMHSVAMALAALFALVLVGIGAAALMMHTSFGRIALSPPPAPSFPQPSLQLAPTADLAQLRQREQARLHEQAAMPIERAMDAIARRGTSAFEPLVTRDAAPWPPQPGSESGASTGGRP